MEKIDEMKKTLKDVMYFDSFRSDVFDQDLVQFNRNEKEKLYYDMMTKHNWQKGELESYEESLSDDEFVEHNIILSTAEGTRSDMEENIN